ncbi:MAG TPA: hypothetical protein VEJ87_05775 [Acidimicrobiales bacterium]|nr:hypothetical protein [Acidimicrobiales bacterium]
MGVMMLLAASGYLFGGAIMTQQIASAGPPNGTELRATEASMAQAQATVRPIATSASTARINLTSNGLSSSGKAFSYGYDLAQQGPYDGKGPVSDSARQVAQSISGAFEDVPIMGWGLPNPEPSPGIYDLSGIAQRVAFVESTGGIPIITLCAAPDWMKGGQLGSTDWTQIDTAPLPQHFEDFAALTALIARTFPQVKYFVVWNELKGFWNSSIDGWDAESYTDLYNDVYTAIKAVRPDALVGGPYVSMTTDPGSAPAMQAAPSGSWGYVDPAPLAAVSYWLRHNVGADFIAVDGSGFTESAGLATDPLTATQKYAAVDDWLRAQTSLPIVWMESHLLPDPTTATQQQQAALRVAVLLQMASSGASVGMQWNPEQTPGWDEGLWTATDAIGGGQATVLAQELPAVLAVLAAPVSLVGGEPPGRMAASGPDGTITVTLSPTTASVVTQTS